MKAAILATAAALTGGALADVAHMRRGHDAFHHRRALHPQAPEETCGCTTEVITFYGSPTLVPISTPTPTPETTSTEEVTTTLHSTSTSTVTVTATPEVPAVTLPTPGVTSFSSTGVYTIPATTLTVTDTTTVCGATSTELPSGTATYGGVTTVVETATTVVCPYATVKPSGSTVTSVIETTTYVCPSAGTYTVVPPTTTYVPTSTVMVYPTPATFTPGTYTQDEQTVTVTRTDYTYVCPTFHPELPSTTAPAPTTTAVPTSTVAPSSTTSVPASSSTSVPVPTGGGQMGMTYSPYTNAGGCKSKADVLQDIATIKQKGFTHVRVYSTDCSSLEFIGEGARQNGLILILGVFIDASGISGAQSQVTDIANWAQWDLVSLIVVGNEAIQNGYCSAGELAGFIASAKQAFKAAGYSGQVTTTEPINVWQASGSALCGAIDILGANIHPFFNAEVSPSQAGKFVQGQVDILEKICPGKNVINLETGWPSKGDANGLAIPGTAEQSEAIHSLVKDVGALSVFFSFSNDAWKDPGAFNVEQWWGCIDQF